MSVLEVSNVLERLSNLIRAEARSVGLRYGLQPVQLEALAYLTQCNRYSDTPQAVTEYLGLTKGTVSQSLKVLEGKGFLRKQADKQDKRVVHLKPTAQGQTLIKQITPAPGLQKGLTLTTNLDNAKLSLDLRTLLRAIQQANGLKTFSVCQSCRFNEPRGKSYFCQLTQEPLSAQDVLLLCREHNYPPAENDDPD